MCARTFGEILELADIDLSIFQEAVTAGSTSHELRQLLPNAVAYLFDMTTITQREMEGFGRWYHDMMDLAVFGMEDDPIIIED